MVLFVDCVNILTHYYNIIQRDLNIAYLDIL